MNLKKGTALFSTALILGSVTASYMPCSVINAEDEEIYTEEEYIPESVYPVRGDVNLDGKVTQLDASLIMKEVLSVESSGESILSDYFDMQGYNVTEAYYYGDVDMSDDGKKFTLTDATMILRALLEAEVSGEEEITDEIWRKVTGFDYTMAAFLWIGNADINASDIRFEGITEDTDIAELTLRVKDDAPDGLYELKYISDCQHTGTFCDSDINVLIPEIHNGIIGVNREVQPVDTEGKFSFVTESASVKQGDTFTVKCSLKNIVSEEVMALNCYIRFDRNIFEAVSLKRSEDLNEFGDFQSNEKKLLSEKN